MVRDVPKPIIEAVAQDIRSSFESRDEKFHRNAIAVRHSVSEGTISRIKKALLEGYPVDYYLGRGSRARVAGVGSAPAPSLAPAPAKPFANPMHEPAQVYVAPAAPEPLTHDRIRGAIKKNGPMSTAELADVLDCSPMRVAQAISDMQFRGSMIQELHGKFDLTESIHIGPSSTAIASTSAQRTYGVLGDNHLCSKYSRLDVLNAAYDEFARRGITDVFNTGNWIDGEARFNKTELVVPPGLNNQINYMIDNYPKRDGITTHYVAGDDHEGWYVQREGIDIGRHLQSEAEVQGRYDLKYLGYGECDVKLEHGSGSACMRVVHPGGGSSYATSYAVQKLVESYQGGEKPQVILAGHWHKAEYGFPREVHCVQTGCTTDQSLFMRKLKLQAHVGFWVINMTQDDEGIITRFGTEWYPFFDKKFYERRYGVSREVVRL